MPLRPRRLSVTEIETWLRDPYAIHARHVLKLKALEPLDEATDAADYGSLVHAGHAASSCEEHGTRWPADAAAQLRRAMARALAEAELRAGAGEHGGRRGCDRIADWVAEIETARRRSERRPPAIAAEAAGTWALHAARRTVPLTGRADRIERRADGSLAILDYKTGTPPIQKEVDAGLGAAASAGGGDGRGRRVRR